MDTKETMKKIYEQTAEHFGVTPEEVETEIRETIQEIFTDPDRNALAKEIQSILAKEGDIPAPEELIPFLALVVHGMEEPGEDTEQ